MKNLAGKKVDFYEVVSEENGIYTLTDGYNTVTVDMNEQQIVSVKRNNRTFKAAKFTKSFRFLINSIEELEEEVEEEVEESLEESLVEEVENLNDDLFQDEDIAYAEEAIERESNSTDFNSPMTYNEFIKLPKEERKEIVRVRVGEEIDSKYLDMICKFNYRVMVNGKDIYDCYFTNLGVRIFRYGKHPKQCKIWSELKDHIGKMQVIGTI